MDQVRDAQVMRMVERIGEHYRTNISNRFIRPALLQLPLDKTTWTHIEFLTEKFDQFRYQGLQIDEVYRQLEAMARFVSATRREVAPTLRHRLNDGADGSDKVLRDMAINAFNSNLKLFSEMLSELYHKIMELDLTAHPRGRALYQIHSEFSNLDDLFLGGV